MARCPAEWPRQPEQQSSFTGRPKVEDQLDNVPAPTLIDMTNAAVHQEQHLPGNAMPTTFQIDTRQLHSSK